jgi:hypothetical protein
MEPIGFGVTTATVIVGIAAAAWMFRVYERGFHLKSAWSKRIDSLTTEEWDVVRRYTTVDEFQYVLRAVNGYAASDRSELTEAPTLREILVQYEINRTSYYD